MDDLLKLHRAAILLYGGADGVLDEGTLHYLTERALLHRDPVWWGSLFVLKHGPIHIGGL